MSNYFLKKQMEHSDAMMRSRQSTTAQLLLESGADGRARKSDDTVRGLDLRIGSFQKMRMGKRDAKAGDRRWRRGVRGGRQLRRPQHHELSTCQRAVTVRGRAERNSQRQEARCGHGESGGRWRGEDGSAGSGG